MYKNLYFIQLKTHRTCILIIFSAWLSEGIDGSTLNDMKSLKILKG